MLLLPCSDLQVKSILVIQSQVDSSMYGCESTQDALRQGTPIIPKDVHLRGRKEKSLTYCNISCCHSSVPITSGITCKKEKKNKKDDDYLHVITHKYVLAFRRIMSVTQSKPICHSCPNYQQHIWSSQTEMMEMFICI